LEQQKHHLQGPKDAKRRYSWEKKKGGEKKEKKRAGRTKRCPQIKHRSERKLQSEQKQSRRRDRRNKKKEAPEPHATSAHASHADNLRGGRTKGPGRPENRPQKLNRTNRGGLPETVAKNGGERRKVGRPVFANEKNYGGIEGARWATRGETCRKAENRREKKSKKGGLRGIGPGKGTKRAALPRF